MKNETWIKVKERLPECTLPFMIYNDENVKEIAWENDHIFVLAFDPDKGVIKARLDRRGKWCEVSTNSLSTSVKITHWMPLPEPPKNN